MFYTEEDIQPVVDAATKMFGIPGRYETSPFVYVAVETPKYGKIWYGDVSGDYSTLRVKSVELAKLINESVSIIDLSNDSKIC